MDQISITGLIAASQAISTMDMGVVAHILWIIVDVLYIVFVLKVAWMFYPRVRAWFCRVRIQREMIRAINEACREMEADR